MRGICLVFATCGKLKEPRFLYTENHCITITARLVAYRVMELVN